MNERRFDGEIARLRSPERLARLEVDRVVELCLEGLGVRQVIDIGTGSGVFAEAFAARDLQVTGIDVSPEMVSAAQGFVPGGNFDLAPAEDIPFPNDTFDLAFLGLVLHETDDATQALQEAKRVSRKRVAVLEWPYEDGPVGPPLEHRIPAETMQANFRKAGFSRIHAQRLEHLALYRLEWDSE
jgi:SAM-dependent methyltransferase